MKWIVEFKTVGSFFITVEAENQKDAEEAGWKAYHDQTATDEIEGTLSWDAEDAHAEEE